MAGATRVMPDNLQKTIDRHKIISAPMLFVRTNLATPEDEEELLAKSRLILPGHLGPALGTYRTDAPTVHGVAILIVANVAASKGWRGSRCAVALLALRDVARVTRCCPR